MNREGLPEHGPALFVTAELWQRVQDCLDGKPMTGPGARHFAFGRVLTCGLCGTAVTPQQHKGHAYNRCFRRCQGQMYVLEERVAALLAEVPHPQKMSEANARLVAEKPKESWREIAGDKAQQTATIHTRFDFLGGLICKSCEHKLDGRSDDAFCNRKQNE